MTLPITSHTRRRAAARASTFIAATLLAALAACSTAPPRTPAATAAGENGRASVGAPATGAATRRSTASGPVTANATRAVVLVSIDGFKPAYLDRGITPTLSQLAADGVRAKWMSTSYPSLTFPNHWTIVTGLRPDRSGVVHNTMRDAALGSFKMGDAVAVDDGRWWGGEPIWVTAEKAGIRSATMFWPGSGTEIEGIRPSQWRPFDKAVTPAQRVDTVLGWLDLPQPQRPRLLTLYFDEVDEQGHAHGPDSAEVNAAVADVDAAMQRLVDGLRARGQLNDIDLVIVSDHGMARVPPRQTVAVEDIVSSADASVVTAGQVVGIAPNPGREQAVAAALLGRHPHYSCWRKGELPARWHYGRHPRVPPIICQMDEGWDAVPREAIAKRAAGGVRGSHGYDPALPSMRALFLAHGPSFRQGAVIEPFDNVDVYPLLATLLGVDPAPSDGNLTPLLPALR